MKRPVFIGGQCELRACADRTGRAYSRIEYIVYILNLKACEREGRVCLTHSYVDAIKGRACFMTIAMCSYCKNICLLMLGFR